MSINRTENLEVQWGRFYCQDFGGQMPATQTSNISTSIARPSRSVILRAIVYGHGRWGSLMTPTNTDVSYVSELFSLLGCVV